MKAGIILMTALAALTIGAMNVSAEEMSEVTEPVAMETTAVIEESTSETSPILLGDVNSDNEVNVRDCAYIARKLAEDKADELFPETADYNRDEVINVRDAASIANTLGLNITPQRTFAVPDKADYDLKSVSGIKAYINDMVIYKAFAQYGITDIKADDYVQSNTWYAPTEFISNTEYYSSVTSVEEYGIEGCFPSNYVTTADEAIADLMKAFAAISERTNPDGTASNMSSRRIRIKWVPADSGGNYRIYVCYGGGY